MTVRRIAFAGRRAGRRGFNLIELLIALAISAALLTATMVALDASFRAYRDTTEEASTHTIARLVVHRILTLVRNGTEFGPVPADPRDEVVETDFIEFVTGTGEVMTIEWREDDQSLYVLYEGEEHLLLGGVIPQFDEDSGEQLPIFTLEYEFGRELRKATVDLAIIPDDDQSTDIDGSAARVIRMVASAMPRGDTY